MAHLADGSLPRAFALHPLAPLYAVEALSLWLAWGVLGGDRFGGWVAVRAEALVLVHAAPLFGLWLGRVATGTLPF